MEEEIDSLTRLPGRGALLQRLEDEIARAERYGVPLSLLLADVDGYEALNGARGPAAGEAALRRLAVALLMSARDGDVVARVDEDKFGLLLPDTDGAGALARAGRLAEEIAATDVGEDDAPLFVTMSVGVATFGPGLAESAALMTHAEEALQTAKAGAGRGADPPRAAVQAFPEGDAPSGPV